MADRLSAQGIHVSDRHMEMARLYLEGTAETRGKWQASALAAGFKRVPPQGSSSISVAIQRVTDERAARAAHQDDFPEGEAPEPEVARPRDPDVERLEEMLTDQGSFQWADLVPLAKRVLAKIGAGLVEGNASQIAALKEILRQEGSDEGRERETAIEVVRVVVLPVQIDVDENMMVDLGAHAIHDPSQP